MGRNPVLERAKEQAVERLRTPSDPGLILQRTLAVAEGLLELLETDYADFRAKGLGEPKGFTEKLGELAVVLDKVTLSYARFKKAEKEWAENMSTEEKLQSLREWLCALAKDQPDLVNKWFRGTGDRLTKQSGAIGAKSRPATPFVKHGETDDSDGGW